MSKHSFWKKSNKQNDLKKSGGLNPFMFSQPRTCSPIRLNSYFSSHVNCIKDQWLLIKMTYLNQQKLNTMNNKTMNYNGQKQL